MKKSVLIQGMSCEHCVMHVRKELEKISELGNIEVEVGKAELESDKDIDDALIIKAVEEAGYEVTSIN